MSVEVLIIATSLVDYGGARGHVVEPSGAIVRIPARLARRLVSTHNALYTDKVDDPMDGLRTAWPKLLQSSNDWVCAGGACGVVE